MKKPVKKIAKKPASISRAALQSMDLRPPGAALETLSGAIHRKITVSLFPTDLEAADQLMDLLRRHCGAVANRSDAVKLALRIALDTAGEQNVKQHFSAIRSEDARNRGKG